MESNPVERVSIFLKLHGLVGSRLVVAVSGGPDSICLLHVLSTLKEQFRLTLQVAHLDHGLREESYNDAAYVRRLAKKLDLPVTIRKADVLTYREDNKLSVEEAAREVRYRFLADVANKMGTAYIATGHTRSDQAETIMLHIIRGTGIKGLVGLKALTPWTLDGRKIALVRPLLELARAETEEYCRRMGLKPKLDNTNLSLTPLRNRIRLKLLPGLKEYNPNVEAALIRLSKAARDEIEHLDDTIAGVWSKAASEQDKAIALNKNALLAEDRAVQAHLIRRAFTKLLGNIKDIEMRHIDDVMSTMILPAGRRIDLPYGLVFVVGYDVCWLGRPQDIPAPFPEINGQRRLNVPGTTSVPGWTIQASFTTHPRQQIEGVVAMFDASTIGSELILRTWQRGDRFIPLGMNNEKKLSDFMTDEKIPRHWRKNIPLVVSQERIIWVVGYRQGEREKITAATQEVLCLEFTRV